MYQKGDVCLLQFSAAVVRAQRSTAVQKGVREMYLLVEVLFVAENLGVVSSAMFAVVINFLTGGSLQCMQSVIYVNRGATCRLLS